MGKADVGLKRLESLRARPDFHGSIELELAKANDALGNYPVAIENYQKVVDQDPENLEVQRNLATALFKNNDLDKSREILERIERTFSKESDLQLTIGHIDFRQKKFEAASQRFQRAVRLNKKSYDARYWLGRALQASKKPAAEEEFRRVSEAITKDPNLAATLCDAHRQYADYMARRVSGWKDAEQELDRYLKCRPNDAEGCYARGLVRTDLQRTKKAIEDFVQAAKLDSSMGKAYAQNAYIQIRDRDHSKKAVESLLKKAIRADASLARPHYLLCNMVKEKNKAQAKRYCERYLKLDEKGDYAADAAELLRTL